MNARGRVVTVFIETRGGSTINNAVVCGLCNAQLRLCFFPIF